MRVFHILALLVPAGCAAPPPPPTIVGGPDPADATIGVGAPEPRSVMAGTVDYRVVEPKDWRSLNDRVAPAAGRSR